MRVYPPRVRGNLQKRRSTAAGQGLSPRVRGNQHRRKTQEDHAGSIPACAGEPPIPDVTDDPLRVYPRVCGGTDHAISDTDDNQVYPRVCGGTRITRPHRQAVRGLSPRVRGNRFSVREGSDGTGSIPACAGEPYGWSRKSRSKRVYPRVCGGTTV